MEVQGRAKGERLIATIADKPVEFADAATKVGLAPNLNRTREFVKTLKANVSI